MSDRVHAPHELQMEKAPQDFRKEWIDSANHAYDDGGAPIAWQYIKSQLPVRNWNELAWALSGCPILAGMV